MKAIVFESKTGNTKKYAELLGQETGLPVYEHKEASKHLNQQDEIIYMGWLFASGIKGYQKALKNYNIKAVCGVGMRRTSEEAIKDMVERNKISGLKAFYLQGGYDGSKLRGINKLMMNMMSKIVLREIEKKEVKTDEDLETIDMINNGKSFASVENLAPVLEWLKQS
ncbi:MAG: flavodoxin domain-containing protein [Acetivibrionales bacterium]|jgi:flavodoxin